MSTRGVIARLTGTVPLRFAGRYHHWDSYPSGLGRSLWHLYCGHFRRDLDAMLRVIVDEHPAGWSSIVGGDFSLPTGFGVQGKGTHGISPQCYCHGERAEGAWEVTDHNASGSGCEWAYAFVPGSDFPHDVMVILSSYQSSGQKMIGMFGQGDPAARWVPIAVVGLGDKEPDWEALDHAPPLAPWIPPPSTGTGATPTSVVEADDRPGTWSVRIMGDTLHYVAVRAEHSGGPTLYCTCSPDETEPSPDCSHAQAVREHLTVLGTIARERRERGLQYSGTRLSSGNSPCVWVWEGSQPTLLRPEASLRAWKHSPAGFEWGYDGSGPAQLALAIVLDFTGDERLAVSCHQQFKRAVVATLGATWLLDGQRIEAFLRSTTA